MFVVENVLQLRCLYWTCFAQANSASALLCNSLAVVLHPVFMSSNPSDKQTNTPGTLSTSIQALSLQLQDLCIYGNDR